MQKWYGVAVVRDRQQHGVNIWRKAEDCEAGQDPIALF